MKGAPPSAGLRADCGAGRATSRYNLVDRARAVPRSALCSSRGASAGGTPRPGRAPARRGFLSFDRTSVPGPRSKQQLVRHESVDEDEHERREWLSRSESRARWPSREALRAPPPATRPTSRGSILALRQVARAALWHMKVAKNRPIHLDLAACRLNVFLVADCARDHVSLPSSAWRRGADEPLLAR